MSSSGPECSSISVQGCPYRDAGILTLALGADPASACVRAAEVLHVETATAASCRARIEALEKKLRGLFPLQQQYGLRNDWVDAEFYFDRCLALSPLFFFARLDRGDMFFRRGRHEEARVDQGSRR